MSTNGSVPLATPIPSTSPSPFRSGPTTPTPTTPTSPILPGSVTTPLISAPPLITSTFTAPTTLPPTTSVITSVVAVPGGLEPSTIVITQTTTPTFAPGDVIPTSSTSTAIAGGNRGSSNRGAGLSPGGTIAIAVVIPVVAVSALVFAGLFWWRRRRQQREDEAERRKEMEAYGFNPNTDPTLPVAGGVGSDVDGQSGYRGWGGTATSTYKASTALSSGHRAPSDPGGFNAPNSPNAGTVNSEGPLIAGAVGNGGHSRKTTGESDSMSAQAAYPSRNAGMQRGPSNASSTYSVGARSRHSADAPIPVQSENYYTDYNQVGPYDNPHQYGQEAIIRDNPARRNTRIERAPHFPNQGSSGVATNF